VAAALGGPFAPVPAFIAPPLRFLALTAGLLALTPLGCLLPAAAWATAPTYGYEFVASYPHDSVAFTQGLIVKDGFFYEGTGLYGFSSLRKVVIETGDVIKQLDLDADYFGEGITALRDTLYQLTWTNHVAFAYTEEDSFERIASFVYPWQGWGLTHDGTHLLASDGSPTVRFLDPRTLVSVASITVHDGADVVADLNELEYIEGRLFANIWYADNVAVIDPGTGLVEAWLDLGGLRDSVAYDPNADVLNGIAFDAATRRFFVTGKRWPEVFEILVPMLQGSVDDSTASAPASGLHLICSPHPFGGRGILTFDVPVTGPVSLSLFDAAGRLVRLLLEDTRPAGTHSLTLESGGLAAGIYFVRLSSAGETRTRALRIIE